MLTILTLTLYFILTLRTYECELYTYMSVEAMENLLITQSHLIKVITISQKLVAEKERIILNKYLSKLKKEHNLSQKDSEWYLGNPINAYTLIMRLYRDLQFVENILNKTRSYRRSRWLVYPTSVDAEGATSAIEILHFTYDQRISELANGTIIGHYSKTKERFVEYVSPMSTNDCLDLAKFYFYEDRSYHIAWLEEALTRYSSDHELCTLSEGEITARIGKQYYFMEDWGKSIYWLKRLLKLKPSDAGAARALTYARRQYLAGHSKPNNPTCSHQTFDEDLNSTTVNTIMRLCRGDSSSIIATNSRLRCYYARGPHAFLLLAPIKAELLNNAPEITMFYDVISDREIEAFKKNSRPLTRSEVYNTIEKRLEQANTRTSYTGCLRSCPEVDAVERRMTQLTGLQRNLDCIQIVNYGIGGYFWPHKDYNFETPGKLYMRISSTVFYMSDVEQGGATVFTQLNLTIFPIKNAAIFWYNLNPMGYGDENTIHTACPVLRGSKWVTAKWPLMMDQDITIGCPLQP